MKILHLFKRTIFINLQFLLMIFCLLMFSAENVWALSNVDVRDGNENPVTVFRWLIEEDRTYKVPLADDGSVAITGGIPQVDPNWSQGKTLSVSFHQSYMPVIEEGTVGDLEAKLADITFNPDKSYYISVLAPGHSIGGAGFMGSDTDVTVYVNGNPIPTAQVTVFAFEDMAPINNAWDTRENGLGGFSIILEDAGGKYGISAGVQSVDVFNNPLCTTYNGDGSIAVEGAGCFTGPDGRVTIPNLAPGKYGVIVVPPAAVEDPVGSGNFVSANWSQTSTIEGKKVIDAWVKANEPPFFGEFGPPGPHVSVGFVPAGQGNPYRDEALSGGSTISGEVVNLHLSRPPDTAFYNGGPFPHTTPWVGLNEMAGGVLGQGLYAARTDGGVFSISGVPPGQYQLVVWDDNMDLIFAGSAVEMADDGSCNGIADCNLGDVPVFQWFTRLENHVFHDDNENGIREAGEAGILEQNVNLRWRDGTIYQAFPTDVDGFAPFDEVFPFFSWLVAEVDFARFKATGATVYVDDGGPVPFGSPFSWDDQLNPQFQGDPIDPDSTITNNGASRTETGVILTEAFQGFLGQTSVIEWGKTAYGFGENGGISGMVLYAVTRAEDDPELAAAEPWEPGIPGVIVNLYDTTGDVKLATTETDSWDDSLPANCQYGVNGGSGTDDPFEFRGDQTDCYDGMRNWNQVRPGVFDGGYAFETICSDPAGLNPLTGACDQAEVSPIPPGRYIVEVEAHSAYEVIRSQDRNVDFGDEYSPTPELLPPKCVGADYLVPPELTLFPGEAAPLAGDLMQLCDRKEVLLSGGANAAADFFLFTQVPISGHIFGFILDDLANEFDPASPQFGEKYAPPFLPVSIRDWTGREIGRAVSDEFGRYNALVPSTATENLPQPSGISPNMLTACMNAKVRTDGTPDPLHNPQYSQFCYTFQYMPGSTTYLDTPVVPVAAFAGPDQNPVDCQPETETPGIAGVSVETNGVGGGPYIPVKTNGHVLGDHEITITSLGRVRVPNPLYEGVGGTQPKTIQRNYRFGGAGTPGTVTLGGQPVTVSNWLQTSITVSIPDDSYFGGVGGQQLLVTRANGKTSVTGVTVQIGLRPNSSVVTVADGESIQDAINAAGVNDLILVGPGAYNEIIIMWKPVQLQGWGAGSTFIDAIKTPFEKLVEWRNLASTLLASGSISLIPGQELGFGGFEPDTFFSEEGAGIFVVARPNGGTRFHRVSNRNARIDGFNISGADTGGGVVVNGYARYLEISNLKVTNNSAFYAGGIRVGHPFVTFEGEHTDARNDFIKIHHNAVVLNGGIDGAGGGIALHTGSDSYEVTDNFVCGNFTTADGAGIAHYGLSDVQGQNGAEPLMANNTVIFNENFNQGSPTNGGGILIAGKPPLVAGNLSPGSGSVILDANLIQGNSAGAGDGGGIQLSRINGEDVRLRNNGTLRRLDYTVEMTNNIIVNNAAALAGGGVSMRDALAVTMLYNTIAHNDNASTASLAFVPGIPSESEAQPGAGVVSYAHLDLPDTIAPGYSDPTMEDNIIWENRKFYWLLDDTDPVNVLSGLCPDIAGSLGLNCINAPGLDPVFDDLAVLGTAGSLTCTNCLVTGGGDPDFVMADFNGNRQTVPFNPEVKTASEAPPAPGEGGNFIRLRYGPLSQERDYHIQAGSTAIEQGDSPFVNFDFDGQTRDAFDPDIGADEYLP